MTLGECLNLKINEELVQPTIPYPTGPRNVGAKSEAIIGVGGVNRPSYSEPFLETPCANPHAGCCGAEV